MSLNMDAVIEAVKQAKKNPRERNFVQSIELIINLRDIDPKKPEGKIQELIELPYPPGKKNKVCVFASGDLALRAKKADADVVIERAELESLAGDKKRQRELTERCDFFIADASLMPLVGKTLGSILGPRGKMPTPVPPTADIAGPLERYRKMVFARLRGQPTIQCRIGDEKMPDEQIAENIRVVVGMIEGKLKRGVKNIESIYVKTAMGSPVRMQIQG